MTKKQLYIIVGVIAIIALGFLLAFYFISQPGTKTGTGTTNPFANFFPFGKTANPVTTGTTGTTGTTETGTGEIPTGVTGEKIFPLLREVTEKPTAGLFSYNKQDKTYVEYAEKESGNVYEVKMEDMKASRISNSLITRVSEAFFGNDGKSIVLRYVKTNSDIITSFTLDLSNSIRELSSRTATTTEKVDIASLPSGKFLTSDISDMKVSSDSKSAFYLTRTGDFNNRTAVGSVFDFQKNTSSDVFLSPFSEWLPVSFTGTTALLQTKASQNVPGFLYSFTIKTGSLQKIIGEIPGLTTLPSPDNQKILYSMSTRSGVSLFLFDRKASATISVPMQTLPEKCVWKKDNLSIYCGVPSPFPAGEYPDSWYQGVSSFRDNIWKIDATTGKTTAVFVPSSITPKPLDMTNLTLSPNQDFLFFINKKDSSLWAFDLLNGESE